MDLTNLLEAISKVPERFEQCREISKEVRAVGFTLEHRESGKVYCKILRPEFSVTNSKIQYIELE